MMRRDYRSPIQRIEIGRGKRLKRILVLGGFLVISVLVQSSLGALFRSFNFRPDLVLLACLWYCLRRGGWNGWGIGMAGGLVKDLFSLGPLGLGVVSLGGACALVRFLSRPLDRANPSTMIAMTAVAALSASLFYFVLYDVFGGPIGWSEAWRSAIRPHLWQTVAAAPVWLPLSARVLRD